MPEASHRTNQQFKAETSREISQEDIRIHNLSLNSNLSFNN